MCEQLNNFMVCACYSKLLGREMWLTTHNDIIQQWKHYIKQTQSKRKERKQTYIKLASGNKGLVSVNTPGEWTFIKGYTTVQKHEYRFTPLKPDSAFGQERFSDAIIPAEVKTVF